VSTRDETHPIYWLGAHAALPEEIRSWTEVRQAEAARLELQLGVLSPALRERILSGLGIEAVRVHAGPPSELALRAARGALEKANVSPASVRLIIDHSTLPGDYPAIWSLASRVASDLGATDAMTLGVHGAGCAGLLMALRTCRALLRTEPELAPALLVAADCVPDGGRCCLPVSVMGDAASAVVLGTTPAAGAWAPRLLSVVTSTLGTHHAVIVGRGSPALPEVDGASFEERILPLHFIMSHRVLVRALERAGRTLEDLRYLVYPNTTALDRTSVARSLGIGVERLCGPGPRFVGHAFARHHARGALAQLPRARASLSLLGPGLARARGRDRRPGGAAVAEVAGCSDRGLRGPPRRRHLRAHRRAITAIAAARRDGGL
jgi:3-oxoacyl-[acyl-carrier-protein] synthase III